MTREAKPTMLNISSSAAESETLSGSMCDAALKKEPLLLHSCCGPCSTSVLERLIEEFSVTVFYYNPNITDPEEYLLRKTVQKDFIKAYNANNPQGAHINFIEGDYDTDSFYEVARGLESEPEGGLRCEQCFRLRLSRTAEKAAELGIQTFGTTLTVSPYKNYKLITKIGMELAQQNGLSWLDRDFKKQAGYQRSIEMSKEYGLYRQHFCGCDFARDKEK